MRFADPQACPGCGGVIHRVARCPSCGLDLTTEAAKQLWQTLVQADWLLAQARLQQTSAEPGARSASSEALALGAATLPAYDPAARPPPPRPARSVSTGSVLLGLGALFLLVAGFIFVTVSWGSLGIVGRALVLLAFTALIGGLATWITRRRLRGSSEALWVVSLGLLTVDWFAAWDQGLFGLDAAPFAVVSVIWSVAVFVIGSVVVVRAHPYVERCLVGPMVWAGSAVAFGAVVMAFRLFDGSGWTLFWSGLAATLFSGGFLVAALRMRHVITWVLLSVSTGLAAAFSIGAAAVEALDSPSLHGLAVDRHGLPMLVVVAAATTIGLLVSRAALPAAVVAGLGAVVLVLLPLEDAWPGRGAYVVASVAVVLGALMLRQIGPWATGGRLATAVVAIALGLAAAPWVGNLLEAADEGARGDGGQRFWVRLDATPDTPGPWWLAAGVFAALTAALVLASRWPESAAVRSPLASAAWVLGAAGLLASVAAAEVPYVLLMAAAIIAGAVLAEVLRLRPLAWSLVGPALVAVAPLVSLPSYDASLVIWLAAAITLAAITVRSTSVWRREPSAFTAGGWAMGAAGIGALAADADAEIVAVCLVVAASLGITAASLVLPRRVGRLGLELAAAVIALIGLGQAAQDDVTLRWQALLWTVAGAVLVLLSVVTADRRWFRWVGSGALGVAYVLRLLASDVDTVEAYTLPFGVLLLGAGLWAMRGADHPTSTRALGPAATLTLLPSLPLALDDPTSLRALLLALGACAFLAVGIVKQWKLPFAAGALVLALIVTANIGPYALAVPRWTLIAAAGALLLGTGVTWEDRVRDGRTVARYVGSMG